MKLFYYDTDAKLVEIFTKRCCNMSQEQYMWIRAEFIYLVSDIQEEEPKEEIEKRAHKLQIVADFLMETDDIQLEEHEDLYDLISDVLTKAAEVEA